MSNSEDILKQAQQRGHEMGLPYAGALLPREAHTLLQQKAGAKVVDVRSRAELDFVGRIPGSVEIEWKTYPGMSPNPNFVQQLRQIERRWWNESRWLANLDLAGTKTAGV